MFLWKPVLVFLGTLSLIAGIAGIFIPGLPVTPFLLLTAGLYVRSSQKLYNRLISNRFFGSYISDYRKNNGMTLKSKLLAVAMMSLMITVSCIFLIDLLSTRLLIIALGIIGAVVMIFIVPTVKQKSG
jgi:uncharacterized membrane protein YbaN (DUF454 family)